MSTEPALDTVLKASPKKLKSGAWGAQVDGTPSEGDMVEITTRGGKTWSARVTRVFWTDGKVSICSTIGLDREPARLPVPSPPAQEIPSTKAEAKRAVERSVARGSLERVQDFILSGNTSMSLWQYLGAPRAGKARLAAEWAQLDKDLREAFLAVPSPRTAPEYGAVTKSSPKSTKPKAASRARRAPRKAKPDLANLLKKTY